MSRQTNGRVRHPIFARSWGRAVALSDRRGAEEHRRELLAGLSGRVVEVGSGDGANFAHYPTTVERVVAIEPERYLRRQAEQAALSAPVPVTVLDGVAEHLPGEDRAFDAGVVSLVLCSVPDQDQALAELFRAIRPGGGLRFYEHVVSDSPNTARLQRLADATIWPLAVGGCHLARDTTAAIRRAGFVLEDFERFPFSPGPLLTLPYVLGTARRPG